MKTDSRSVMGEPVDNEPINGQTDKLGKKGMIEENATLEDEQRDRLKDAGSLDLNLVFEVGRTTMTVEQIGQLNKGRVIQLSHKLDAGVPVDIKVNDQVIARGRIVGVGDEVGVQITETGAR